jgi:hypothetical protein
MTRFALSIAAVAVLSAFAAPVGTSAPARALASCGPAKVGGATVMTYCGPAKVTFTFGGRTYRISGGKCALSAGYWTLLVGRQTLPPATPKFTGFQAGFLGRPKARTYTKSEFVISLELPGAGWSLAFALPHKVTVAAGGKKGTFRGSFFTGSKAGTKPASGSWTC